MVPLKWGVGKWYVWDIWGVQGVIMATNGEKEGSPTWDNTYQMKLHVPPTFIVGVDLAHVGGW